MTEKQFKEGVERNNNILINAYKSALSDPSFKCIEPERQSMLNVIGILESPVELWAFKRKTNLPLLNNGIL
jgi:hypothetical protein